MPTEERQTLGASARLLSRGHPLRSLMKISTLLPTCDAARAGKLTSERMADANVCLHQAVERVSVGAA